METTTLKFDWSERHNNSWRLAVHYPHGHKCRNHHGQPECRAAVTQVGENQFEYTACDLGSYTDQVFACETSLEKAKAACEKLISIWLC